MPVLPLTETQSKDRRRAYLDAIIQIVPWVGGSIATVMAHHLPYAGAKEVTRTVNDLCVLVNQLEQELAPIKGSLDLTPRLTALAILVAKSFCQQGDHYLTGPIATDDFFSSFAGIPRTEIEDAIVELIKQGFLTECRTMGQRFRSVVRAPQLFFLFDPDVYGWFPAIDACHAGQLMIDNSEFCTSEKLDKHLGWPRRRLNSALLFLQIVVFDENHYSKTAQTDYPSWWYHPQPEERYELRQLRQKLSLDTDTSAPA